MPFLLVTNQILLDAAALFVLIRVVRLLPEDLLSNSCKISSSTVKEHLIHIVNISKHVNHRKYKILLANLENEFAKGKRLLQLF